MAAVATHMRITVDIPLTKERRFGAILKALDPALETFQSAVETEGGTLELDAVTIRDRKAAAPAPAALEPPSADMVTLAEIGAGVSKAAEDGAEHRPGQRHQRTAA